MKDADFDHPGPNIRRKIASPTDLSSAPTCWLDRLGHFSLFFGAVSPASSLPGEIGAAEPKKGGPPSTGSGPLVFTRRR